MQDFVGARGLLPPERLAALCERRDGPGLTHLAGHFGLIAACVAGLAWTAGTWWCVPFLALQGMAINFLYAPLHECDHYTAFRTRWLNIAVARVCGFLLLYPNDYHRCSHYQHHRHTQDWEQDPEINERAPYRDAWSYLVALAGIVSLWPVRVRPLVMYAAGVARDPFVPAAQRPVLVAVARWHMAGYALIAAHALATQSWWPVYYWLGPMLLMRWTYLLQGLGEHTGLTHEPNTLLNTRTLATGPFMRWLNWNMTWHTVHHTFPAVPFHRLGELHREVESRLGFALPTDTYWSLHRRHLRALAGGQTELDLCAADTERQRAAGRLAPAPAVVTAGADASP